MVKRAQLKIQQMAFMLIAVFILFVLVGLFVFAFRFSGLRESATELEEKEALLLVTKLSNSPEFSCEGAFGNRINCIDADKVLVLKDSITKYYDFWGVSNIIIRKTANTNIECNTGNYENCGYIDVLSKGAQGYPVENFITLCKKSSEEGKTYDNCEISKLIIYYESEQ